MTAHHLPSQHDRAAAGRSLRILIFAALTGVALLAQPLSAFAAGTFYVDITNPAASASGPGTEAQPFSTISAAINVQKGPGTTILVKPGTYREMVTINASGSSGNPFVIQAFGSPVIVDGADDLSATSKWAAYSGNIYVASSVNWGPMQVFIDGVRLTASTASPAFLPTNSFVWVSGQGLFVNVGGGNPGTHACLVGHRTSSFYLSGRSYITIDGFVTTRTDDRAIRLGSSSNNCVIRNNTCTFNFKYGIYISGCSNDLVEKNVVSDNADHGINLSSSSTLPTSFCTIQDNESFRNAHPTIRKATGILVIGSPNNLIQRNRLHDNQDSGLQIDTGSDNCVSVQNRSWNNGDHGFDQLYCNGVSHVGDVAYNNFKDGFSIEGTAPNGSVYDCIAINNGLTTNEFNLWVNDSSSVGFHSDYNIFWNSTSRQPIKFINTQYSTIAAFTSATGQDAHSTQIDPKFQNPALGDFHLQPGSLAIDAANSAVPNWPATDAEGSARRDDPTMQNVGAGPIPYADRGALEFLNNIPPVAALTATPTSGTAPVLVTLDASGSYDPDGTVASYTFTFGDGSTVGPQSQSTTTHTYLKGNWVAIVTITDNSGSTTQAAVNISITGSNLGPETTIDNPPADVVMYAGQALNLQGTAIDPDNNYPLTYAWNLGGGAPNQTVEDPGPIIFNTPGTYSISFAATDALGEPDQTPDTRTITVSPAPVGVAPDEVHYTMTSQTSVTFDWRGYDTTLRYGLTTAYGQTVTGVTPTPIPFSSMGPFLEARIPGLLENTTYHYSIGAGVDHTFHTPPPRGSANYKVYVEGDIGDSAHYSRMATIQNHIAADPPSMALLVGDLAYGNVNQLKSVDAHFNDVMKWSQDVPYMPAWGNHEWEGGAVADNLLNYKGRFDFPNPQTSPGSPLISCCGEDWYWFDYGNVRFINYPEPWTGALTDWSSKATGLMDQAQADTAIKFIVTFGHRPAYSSGYHISEIPLQTILNALGSTHSKYVLNLNGHSHNYERSYPQNGVTHITAGTGGADLEENTTGCLWVGGCPPPAWSAFRALHHVEVRLTVNPSTILVEAICGPAGDVTKNINDITCDEGTVVDSYLIGDKPPVVAAPSTASTAENSAVSVNVSVSDPDGQPINSLVASGLPAGATFTADPGNATGHLTWTPSFSQAGTYPVSFTASNTSSGSATTTITVTNVDRAPVVTAPATATGLENSPMSVSVTAADSDGDAISSLTATGLPPGATFTPGSGNTSGTLTWTPNYSQSGSYNVTFTATNALSGSSASSITVTNVDRAPVVTAQPTNGVVVGALIQLQVKASDPDGDPVTSLVESNLPSGATFTADPGDTSGTFSWTPGAGQVGVYTLTYTAANALSGSATTVLNVTLQDSPPVVIAPSSISESTLLPFSISVSASDPDGNPITSLTVSGKPQGSTFTPNGANTGGVLSWTPAANDTGNYHLTFTATNALSGSASTKLTIFPKGAPVVTAPATATVAENSLVTVNVTAADPDGDLISSLTASGLPAGATFTAGAGNTSGTLSWTPTFAQAGSYEIVFTAANALAGSSTTTITVTNVDRAPVATAPATMSGKAGALMTINVTASDPDGEAITTLSATGPAGSNFVAGSGNTTGTWTWTPGVSNIGTTSVTFTASNLLSGSFTSAITVLSSNNLPTASLMATPNAGAQPLPVTLDASQSTDSDGTIISYRFNCGDGTVIGPQSSGVAAHVYAAGNWTASVTVTDNDGGTATVSIPVTVAPPPNLAGNPSFESDLNGWSSIGSANLTRVAGGSDGVFSAQLSATVNSTATFGINDHPDWVGAVMSSGVRYRYIAWVRSATSTGTAKIQVTEYLVATGAKLGSLTSTGVVLSPTWQMITGDYITVGGPSATTLDFWVKDWPRVGNETFQVDNISIRDVTLNPGAPSASNSPILPLTAAVQEVTPEFARLPLTPVLYPSPVREHSTLGFATSVPGRLSVEVLDLAGRRVRSLADDSDAPAGIHRFEFDGRGGDGQRLGAGVYFYRIMAAEGVRTSRFVILR
jgi:parallel beta-helix repeat protein